MESFTIGCDPEFFLKSRGKHVSAIGLIGGSKEEPKALDREGFGILEDNVAVEFNVAPSHNHVEFIESIQYVMQELRKTLPERYEFSKDSAIIFSPDELVHPKALEFGCEPDFNAWTKKQNPRPCALDANLRSAGGHVHIGVAGVDKWQLIRAADLFLGVPAIKLDVHGARRRASYGKAGCCRLKEYGAEYRTLSNFWIFSEELIKWVYDQTARAVSFVKSGNVLTDEDGLIIQKAINSEDQEAYEYLTTTYQIA